MQDEPFPVNARGQRICGAKTRNSRVGLPTCQQTRIRPNGRCRMHGGNAGQGKLASQYRTGRYSKYLPDRLREAYEGSLSDPALLSLKEDVALTTATIEGVLDGRVAGAALDLVGATWRAFRAAIATGDRVRIQGAADEVDKAIAALLEQRSAFREVERLQRHKAKLVSTEFKRQIAAATMIDAASAWALVSALQELIKAHVPDALARRNIADGLVRLVGPPAASRAD